MKIKCIEQTTRTTRRRRRSEKSLGKTYVPCGLVYGVPIVQSTSDDKSETKIFIITGNNANEYFPWQCRSLRMFINSQLMAQRPCRCPTLVTAEDSCEEKWVPHAKASHWVLGKDGCGSIHSNFVSDSILMGIAWMGFDGTCHFS